MGIGTFILIILAIWLLPKLFRGYMFVHRAKKQAQQFYDQMYGGQQAQTEPKRRKGGWSKPVERRKKIDPSVGEYVRFSEIDVTETAETTSASADGDKSSTTTYTVEQQVTDAEWEEIK